MSYLEIGGHRHTIAAGEVTIGSDTSSAIQLSAEGVAPRHAIVQGLPDGQVAIRKTDESLEILINGVRLGPQPTPLLHGDKIEIAGQELLFVDERRSGSTQYVQAMHPSALAAAAKPAAKRKATTATGGRLVSLTDGREYTITGASLMLGRDASCDVVLTSKSVSRRHAEIIVTPKGYLLVDSSTNGTIVNGKKIENQHLLARGDVVQCGEHEFRFYADVAPEPAEAEAAAPAVGAAPGAQAPPPKARVPPAPPVRPTAPAAAPPGAAHRLSNTLHGMPGIKRPGAAPGARSAAATAARPSGARELASVVVRSGPLKGQRFPIRVPIVNVGRAEYNDIVLPDDSVSTTHAKIQRREGIWVLVDLDSTNGTLVDGERVHGEVPLAPGALIRFGEVKTIFSPTDDTVGVEKGGSTRVISAVKLPDPPGTGDAS